MYNQLISFHTRFFLSIILLTLSGFNLAQDLDHHVIATDGAYAENNQFSISYTIGEVVTEFSRDTANNVDLAQGFQQSYLSIVSVEDHVFDIEIAVYPNPAIDHLNVSLTLGDKEMRYSLFDIGGKLIRQERILSDNFQIGFSTLSTGSYVLVFTNKEQRIKTLQVQKSH